MTDDIGKNFLAVNKRIAQACEASGRELWPQLLAVSKKHGTDKIKQLLQLGQQAFGESYVQEGVQKVEALKNLDITWHFIGPIQSNKTKLIAENFAWVQSVDRMKVLSRLNDQRPAKLPPLNVLLQLKVGDESTKSGASQEALLAMVVALRTMKNIHFRGLMCIPPPSVDSTVQKSYFSEVLALYKQLQSTEPQVDTLSMGMSGDLEAAIQMGSTMVRVGTDLFGQRPG
ncbi:YggS family pyridoxal phosphate-dependent enzyme [Marinicella litoralis]|uniref:Pyridoxal phosphate homeostasis protein n=1 Tax=Marinicella litoralis TaxID=644220 RepID=A0A4R6XJC3_9GAMM|nr:YggS family pyridoxal phosphate-dependent enzyme [Marinicella litoralis]TDR19602.1 hypothetical protein C8D91_2159 [Marinicella litoralis]